MNKIKTLFKSKDSKKGSYSVMLTAIVIGIVIVVNLILGTLPSGVRQLDISSTNIYDISDTSTALLDSLDKDITFTLVATTDSIDERITRFVDKYADLSGRITVDSIDPVLHPSALTDLDTEKDTLVVSCADTGKSTSIPFTDMIQYDEMSYYYYGTETETAFDGEGQLTSAVNYVSSDTNNIVYTTSGHGESSFSTTLSDLMTKANITVNDLNLLTTTEIPEDCGALIMNAPTSDITTDEATLLTSYLADGGKVILLTGKAEDAAPNLESVLNTYGLQTADGYIYDSSRCYQGNAYAIIPTLSLVDNMSDGMTSDSVLLYGAAGMTEIDPARDTIAVSSFMKSSASSAAVVDDSNYTEGSYILGAVATEEIAPDEDTDSSTDSTDTTAEDADDASDTAEETADTVEETSRLTVVSGYTLIDSSITDSFSSLGNLTLFMNLVTANFDNTTNVSIPSKSLEVTYNTVSNPGPFSLLLIIGIPVCILIAGFVVWMRRRKA